MPEWMTWAFLFMGAWACYFLMKISARLRILDEWLKMIWENQNTHHRFRMNMNFRSQVIRIMQLLEKQNKLGVMLMEFFFYDVALPVFDVQGLVADGLGDLAMEWIGDDAGRSLLVLGADMLIVQGYVEAENREEATRQAMAVANDLYRNQLGQQLALPTARVRDPLEQLTFLNAGLLPEYQLPHISLHHVMELGGAAHMRASQPTPTEARLYRSQPSTEHLQEEA